MSLYPHSSHVVATLAGIFFCWTFPLFCVNSRTALADGLGSCLPSIWGGKNGETSYTVPYHPQVGAISNGTSTYAASPPWNLNTPQGTGIPVRTDAYGTVPIPQAGATNQPVQGLIGSV
ncbi:MAG TPA: hypothetical protein DEB39_00545, partial [Planctomycetaceae bacterium]|nr:hypothetical protein [Planctomycetaceae bacterium]